MYKPVLGVFMVFILGTIYGQDEDSYLHGYPYTFPSVPFDWKLFKELAIGKKNLVVSPTCLKVLLALVYQGSIDLTKYEYENVFEVADKKHIISQYQFVVDQLISLSLEHQAHVGSRIFLDSNLVPEQEFAKVAKDVFKIDLESMDFFEDGSKKTIDNWVGNFTNGKMTQLMTGNLTDNLILIANIAYFKGIWRYQFPKNQTFLGKFNLIKDRDVVLRFRTVTVTYMTIEESFYYYENSNLKVKIVRLPYKGGAGHFAMFVILPTSNESLQSVVERISEGNIAHLLQTLWSQGKKRVRVTLPKFRISSEERLTSTLQKFGMYRTFDPYQNPSPVPIADRGNRTYLRIADVIQKVGIEVDETGQKGPIGNKTEEVEAVFEAKRSFLFFVSSIGGFKLIVGKVENPVEEDLIQN